MNLPIAEPESADFREVCTVLVLYDNESHRTQALRAGNTLVNQFWPEVELKFHWWRTDFLLDPHLAPVAARDALEADLFLVCSLQTPASLPALEAWFERWLEQRSDFRGAVLDLLAGAGQSTQARARTKFWTEVCHRGGFDYLTTGLSETKPGAAAETPVRSDTAASHSRPPTRHGLNE